MLLTGPSIEEQIKWGRIRVEPYEPLNVGPHSVDLRLHPELKVYDIPACYQAELAARGEAQPGVLGPLDMRRDNPTRPLVIPEDGLILMPGTLYLGRTVEVVGTDHFAFAVAGRSSVGRLGIQIHVTAGFCDAGFHGSITLEITAVTPVRVYPGERICQVAFSRLEGHLRLYEGRYQGQEEATPSRFHQGGETVRDAGSVSLQEKNDEEG